MRTIRRPSVLDGKGARVARSRNERRNPMASTRFVLTALIALSSASALAGAATPEQQEMLKRSTDLSNQARKDLDSYFKNREAAEQAFELLFAQQMQAQMQALTPEQRKAKIEQGYLGVHALIAIGRG